MRFKNCVIDPNIAHSISYAESLLKPDSRMIKELQGKTDWKYNSHNVVDELLKDREPVSVYTYRPWNPFTKAIGYFDGKAIHINIKVLENYNFHLVTGLLLHEYAHYCGFGHGNNYKTQEKCLYSVPYYLSENTSKW